MAPPATTPTGVWPATAVKLNTRSNNAGMATVRPMDTTNLATAEAVRRWRKISRSRINPTNGARTNTARTSAGSVGQSQSVRALKYRAAEMYAWAPKARLNTPDVL